MGSKKAMAQTNHIVHLLEARTKRINEMDLKMLGLAHEAVQKLIKKYSKKAELLG